jgi:hypothetical protein
VKEEAEIWWIRGGGRKRKRFNGKAAEEEEERTGHLSVKKNTSIHPI